MIDRKILKYILHKEKKKKQSMSLNKGEPR